MSRQPGVAATFFYYQCCRDLRVMSRLPFYVVDVATSLSCCDLLSLADDVATLISLQTDVATVSASVLMSRLFLTQKRRRDIKVQSIVLAPVATSFWYRDLIVHYTELNAVATSE